MAAALGALLGALAALGIAPARADDLYASGRVYLEGQVGAANVRVADLQFYPLLGGITAGVYVRPGIALELHAEGGIDGDDDFGFELGFESAAGAGVRFESPPIRRASGYITLGYATWTLSQELVEPVAGDERRLEDDFGGLRASIGAVQRFERVPALSASAEFRTYYNDDGVRATALLLGLRLSAP